MLYLADEMLKNRHKTFTLTIGKPIPWQTFDKTKDPGSVGAVCKRCSLQAIIDKREKNRYGRNYCTD